MDKNYFYTQVDITNENNKLINQIKSFANENSVQSYVIREPLGEEKYEYEYKEALNILIPGYKILIVNLGSSDSKEFEYYCEDFIEDLSHISDKFDYKIKIGRPRGWKRDQIEIINLEKLNLEMVFANLDNYKLTDPKQKRISELLVSLLIGSINSIDDIDVEEPETLLDKIKQKIVLFDSDQTRFIFENVNQPRITIQGLAGTGKTELLLHKLKELYVKGNKPKIAFTCHSKTLASHLKKRVPEFFTFMKVEEQIQWNERLWVNSSWGSQNDSNSGLYSLICSHYEIPFKRWSRLNSFDKVCADAIEFLQISNQKGEFEPFFDYILIDESQDFTENFFALCEMVSKESVYVAGDIFQNIFDNDYSVVKPDFLLNKVYRTDPRTLMFSHAVGLALFERPVVNWLEDREWEACGYNIVKKDEQSFELEREKVRRFEDIENMQNIQPVELFCEEYTQIPEKVIRIIKEIQNKHPTVKPDDIGIVFVDDSNNIYKIIDILSLLVNDEFDWNINRGYENKGQIEGTLFVSNRNNIKGLEFPFLISVVLNEVEKSIKSRNTLYMTLTRSFISSYLIMSDRNLELYHNWKVNLSNIIQTNRLSLTKPKIDEVMSQELLKINRATYKTYQEIVEDILIEYGISTDKREIMFKILEAFSTSGEDSLTENQIRMIIKKNSELLYGKGV